MLSRLLFEGLMHRVVVDVIVAVFVGSKFDDESVADALLEFMLATPENHWKNVVPGALQLNCPVRLRWT